MVLLSRTDLVGKGITLSEAHICRLVKANKFPKPIKITGNRNAWIESEIDGYINKLIAAREPVMEAA